MADFSTRDIGTTVFEKWPGNANGRLVRFYDVIGIVGNMRLKLSWIVVLILLGSLVEWASKLFDYYWYKHQQTSFQGKVLESGLMVTAWQNGQRLEKSVKWYWHWNAVKFYWSVPKFSNKTIQHIHTYFASCHCDLKDTTHLEFFFLLNFYHVFWSYIFS